METRTNTNNKKQSIMKAVKLNKIQWDLTGLTKEEKEKAMETLPTVKGFMADDNFNVAERVVEDLDALLLLCAPKGEKTKKIYKKGGELSEYGEMLVNNLESNIKWRLRLEFKGVAESDMPVILDEVMMGVENVTGMKWEGHSVNELMNPIMHKIWDKRAVNLADKMSKMMEEEEED